MLQPEGVLPDDPRAQFAGCLLQHFGARYGSGGIGLLTQPLLGEAIELILKPHCVLVLRRHNPHLASTQSITTAEGDSLQAGQPLLVPAYLPSTELPAGEWIVIPRRRAAVVSDVWDHSRPPEETEG